MNFTKLFIDVDEAHISFLCHKLKLDFIAHIQPIAMKQLVIFKFEWLYNVGNISGKLIYKDSSNYIDNLYVKIVWSIYYFGIDFTSAETLQFTRKV